MTIKCILARVDGTDLDNAVLAYALQAARRFAAQIDVVHVRFNPADLAVMAGYGPIADLAGLAEALQRSADTMAVLARQRFDDWVKANGLVPPPRPDAAHVAARWLEPKGPEVEAIARLGRLSDLIVIARPVEQTGALSLTALETALFDTSRPVLMVPENAERDLFQSPTIAWNGSAEAAQAVAAAWPFLTAAANAAGVYTAAERDRSASTDDFLDYLKLHDVTADLLTPDASADSVGADLLAQAGQRKSGLIVMGAYTHGRVRQIIFGGVTRHVVHHAEIPVLMAH